MSGGFSNKGSSGGSLSAAEELWVQSGTAGILLLEEQAVAPGATAGVGKVYVKAADSLLYFLDDSGVEYPLTGGGPSTASSFSRIFSHMGS